MIRSIVLGIALTAALTACGKNPRECKEVQKYFCEGEMKGPPEECELAKRAASTKNAKQCAQGFANLKAGRVERERRTKEAEKNKAFETERDARNEIQKEMDVIAAPAFDLEDRKAALEGMKKLKPEEKKELEEVKAKLAEINGKLNELALKLEARAGVKRPDATPTPVDPNAPAPAPAPAPGTP